MRKLSMPTVVLAVLLSAIVSLLIVRKAPAPTQTAHETAYQRVMRTGTIRCGYNSEPPFVIVDPNTHKVSGAGVDIVEGIGKLLGLKIEWTEQVGWEAMTAGLQAGRYDMVCNGKWVLAPQARGGQFTPSIYFSTVHAYARVNDARFDRGLTQLNDPAYTVTSMDGEVNYYIARDIFPKAKRIEFPSMTDTGLLFESVIANKADITFAAGFTGSDYMAHNPGKVKQVSTRPLALFDTAFMFNTGEAGFAGILDAAIRQMQAAGTINSILDRYGIGEDKAMRVSLPIAGAPVQNSAGFSPAVAP